MESGKQGKRDWISIVTPIVVFLCALMVFLPNVSSDFVDLDDFELLINNTKWRGLGPEQIRWMFSTTMFGHYQPLTWLSYGLTYVLFGFDEHNAAPYHFGNVL